MTMTPPPRLVPDQLTPEMFRAAAAAAAATSPAEAPGVKQAETLRRVLRIYGPSMWGPDAEAVEAIADSLAAAPAGEVCDSCNGTGSLHKPDGEYVGECPHHAAPAAPAPVSRGERIRQLNYEIWMDSDGMSGVEPPDDWKANYPTTAPRVTGGREALLRCLGFFASVIKSGEPWTEACQQEYDAALQAATGGEG